MMAKGTSRRPRYRRADDPPGMRFRLRDGAILRAIYDYDGVLARRHLKDMFWPTASRQAMERRLSLLYHNGYLDWPSIVQRRTRPIPESIVWLGWKGMLWVAGQAGVEVDPPNNDGENQQRKFARGLRERGVRWLREPRWIQLGHDLAVVDFRLMVEKAVDELPHLALEEWIPEGMFLKDTDVIEYSVRGKDGEVKKDKKGVRPDGYFTIVGKQCRARGSLARARFLLELDRSTYDNPRFGREKIIPGIAYITSPEYRGRFGANSGRWLVVTTGERRMINMKNQAEVAAGRDAGVFYFTVFDKVSPQTMFTGPIWYQGGSDRPAPLFRL